jgi:indolepyruvate ferredoxin oxidoreductase alpha subunit
MANQTRRLLNGDEAVAHAALDAGVVFGSGYPGTPSTEILEVFGELGGHAEWAPNEKVALEVALGAAFGNARAICTMKHVGLNVAADPLFTAAETGVDGALVIIVCDDPGMASSQNEQDSRRYAVAAGVPMLEPADSQEAYDFFGHAVEISEKWRIPVLLRMTTRVCHSKSILSRRWLTPSGRVPSFEHKIRERVMIPAYARPAHRRLREKLAQMAVWNSASALNRVLDGKRGLGIVANGVTALHACEAAPGARLLKLGMTYPLPIDLIRKFAGGVDRCVVLEEGDPILVEACRAEGIPVEGKAEMYRFGELNVERVRRILAGDVSPEPVPARGKPPQLCPGCPHRSVFTVLREMGLTVSGDIGCYTLGVLPPFEAMDTCVCMGASIGVALGLRHVLPDDQARKVVSVIGDSTFVHSGITGLVEMVYNPPKTGHVVLILDNGTTAMTGLQEHPGTGRSLTHGPARRVVYEDLARALGIARVSVMDAQKDEAAFARRLKEDLESGELCVIITRKPCLLTVRRTRAEAAPVTGDACPTCAGTQEGGGCPS